MRILIADDDRFMLSTLEFRLKKDGHEVIATKDGMEALEKIEELNPDLIITDITMPFSSGLEIAGVVREKSKTPIIILSGIGQESTVLEAFKIGVDDYMTKPFSPTELSARVRRFQPMGV